MERGSTHRRRQTMHRHIVPRFQVWRIAGPPRQLPAINSSIQNRYGTRTAPYKITTLAYYKLSSAIRIVYCISFSPFHYFVFFKRTVEQFILFSCKNKAAPEKEYIMATINYVPIRIHRYELWFKPLLILYIL